ncbi:PadR family transcriptional regulator [Agreia sp. COWG]|uniref:PadR family transcriptional regulator n=1 Tax=Agreia sp. COWG TaxID=2773266 RepID=UPI001928E71D|nr:PadR family transcriptional regulator [Agreia sp. COWG]CAD5999564.1 PadR domain-containing protein [Agreia sp. COWG]
MSVRSGILAVLSLGPAYGLQIHGEIEARTDRLGRINVGQIYSTLDRLESRGLVLPAGETDDGLPLYGLTSLGELEMIDWCRHAEPNASWSSMVGQVLMVISLPGHSASALIADYRRQLLAPLGHPGPDALTALADAASSAFASAGLTWLDSVELATREPDALARPLGQLRPRRGRRPTTD